MIPTGLSKIKKNKVLFPNNTTQPKTLSPKPNYSDDMEIIRIIKEKVLDLPFCAIAFFVLWNNKSK